MIILSPGLFSRHSGVWLNAGPPNRLDAPARRIFEENPLRMAEGHTGLAHAGADSALESEKVRRKAKKHLQLAKECDTIIRIKNHTFHNCRIG